jgi:ArsR family transcriptional regulator
VIQSVLDSILALLENPTRRKIIERLSQEPTYPLQLAKDLGLGQQLVAKHLQVMEKAGLVSSSMTSSPQGPERRTYILNKSVSVSVDIAPHLFSAKISSFSAEPEPDQISEDSAHLMEKIDDIAEYAEDHERIRPFANVLNEIDRKIEDLENERIALLCIRNIAMNEVSEIIRSIGDPDERRVLHHTLNKHDESIMNISEALNLREATVRQILAKLRKELELQ